MKSVGPLTQKDLNKSILKIVNSASTSVELSERVSRCRLCDIRKQSALIPGKGNMDADYFFVMSERDETAEGTSLFGVATWEFFVEALDQAGIELSNIWMSSAALCHPRVFPFAKAIKDSHINACKARLIREIRLVNPRIVIALGTKAVKACFAYVNPKPNLSNSEGKVLPARVAGVVTDYDVPVLISQNPILLCRFPDDTPTGNNAIFLRGLQKASTIVEKMREISEETT